MTSVIVNEGGSVIEHDEIIYHNKPTPEPEPKPEPEKECCCGKTYKVVLHFH